MKEQDVEDIYELSPMQQGMLFHTLYEPAAGEYFEQMICTLRGELEVGAFQEAWQEVVARHPILRSSFHWEELDEPLQVVHKQVSLSWAQHDWRGAPDGDLEDRLAAFLQADQDEGFQLDLAPLMRFALIQITDRVYEFVLSHHHLLLDGWSTPIILREVFAFYDARGGDEPLHLQPARPYSDYIAWLRQQDRAKGNEFWRENLRGFVAPTPLIVGGIAGNRVTDSAMSMAIYAEETFRLSAEVTSALQSLARRQGLTLNSVLQGAWAILLSRYSGESDVVFGATVSGRPTALPEVESMVGLFVNTLPVRARATGGQLLVPWLKELQTQQIEREQHAYASLAELQQMSDGPKGMPLFESILVFESYPSHNMRQERRRGLEISNLRGRERTNYPLTVVVNPGAEVSGRIAYDTRRFETSIMRRMVGHLQTLLEGIAANPDQRLGDLSMLTPAERRQLLVEWNDTKKEYPTDKCIHRLFEAQAARTPEAVAVLLGDQRLTYGELNACANQLARYLISLGVGAETRVAICVERSLDMVVGLLGILKAGGCYVPLDPTYPKERLAFMLDDAQAPVVLTHERFVASFSGQNLRVFCFERDWPSVASLRRDDLTSNNAPAQLAYIIYTSGSTGKPKGVRVPHRGLLNLISWYRRTGGITTADRITQTMSLAFDAAGFEIWPCLTSGAALYLVPQSIVSDPVELRDFLIANAIIMVAVPTPLAEQLLGLAWQKTTALRVMFTGGDALRVTPSESLPFQLVNMYGPTENTVTTTTCIVPPNSHAVPPIGRPIDNVQIYILDAFLQPAPIGVPGELCIAGDNLALGYHDRPSLTAEKFIANPFGGGALYRSGDLARYSPNGDIEFLGRIDTQVKIRGFRIELGEIEALLGQHPGVREVIVTTRGESAVDKRLMAYMVPDEQPTSLGELQDFLSMWLPEYMIPKAIALLEALPMTPNGKIDRRALSSPDETRPAVDTSFVAPRTATEEALAVIWHEVLGLSQIGVHDNFFELGGHSLLATQVLSRVHENFTIDLPLRCFFESPTVARFAARVVSHQLELSEREALEQIVDEIDALSDDEVREMLPASGLGRTSLREIS